MKYIYFLIFLALLSGCQSNAKNTKNPYILNMPSKTESHKIVSKSQEKIELSTIEAKHQERLAQIKADKEKQLKKLELEKSKIENQTKQAISQSKDRSNLEIEKSKQQTAIAIQKNNKDLYQNIIIALIVLSFALMLMIYLLKTKAKKLEQKMHEDELRHKEYMMLATQYNERINKTLDLLASDKTDKALKKDLIKLLKNQENEQPKMIES